MITRIRRGRMLSSLSDDGMRSTPAHAPLHIDILVYLTQGKWYLYSNIQPVDNLLALQIGHVVGYIWMWTCVGLTLPRIACL